MQTWERQDSYELSEVPGPLPAGKVVKRNVLSELWVPRFRFRHKDVSAFLTVTLSKFRFIWLLQ